MVVIRRRLAQKRGPTGTWLIGENPFAAELSSSEFEAEYVGLRWIAIAV
jgi:hypothetical protein